MWLMVEMKFQNINLRYNSDAGGVLDVQSLFPMNSKIFQILCGSGFEWIASANGHVPEGSISAGSQSNGEPLYVGRAHYQGSLTPGKIHQSHNCLYIPFGGAEHSVAQYEALVMKSMYSI